MLQHNLKERFPMKRFAATIASAIAAISMANAATIVDINSKPSDNGTTLSLAAGIYEVSFIDGLFDAWNAWGKTKDCDAQGENCSKGWLTNVDVLIDNTIYKFGRNGKFETAQQALDNASPFTLTLTKMTEVTFYIGDSNYSDNVGGLSLSVASMDPVPVPAAGLLFLGGVAAYNASRRRRQAF